MVWRKFWHSSRDTFTVFFRNRPFQMAGALSFYTLLSLAPLLMVVTALVTLFWGDEAVKGQLAEDIERLFGRAGAEVISTILKNTKLARGEWRTLAIGIATAIFGASTVFVQLQSSLNQIWGVETSERNFILAFLRTRLISIALILLGGCLLVGSLVRSTFLNAVAGTEFGQQVQSLAFFSEFWRGFEMSLSIAVLTVLTALVFKLLPDTQVSFRNVLKGAFVTAALFEVGKYFISLYLGQSTLASMYGAAGSLVIFLVWIYYSALIFFFGASVTYVDSQLRAGLDPVPATANPADAKKADAEKHSVLSDAENSQTLHLKLEDIQQEPKPDSE